VEPALAGSDVVLTIDRQIQAAAERALAAAVERYHALGGSAVVLDVDTGEILAMASVPTLDPARTGEADPYVRRNRVLTDVFEPGSVNKVITAAAALEEGMVTPGQVFTVPDRYQVGDKTFSDAHAHPTEPMTFSEIIGQSSNIGTIQVAEQVGPDLLYEYLRKFGYGAPSGTGFPGESGGLLPAPDTWWDTSLPTISIGQGVAATLLQVASVFETVASGGEWIEPSLVQGTVGPDGQLVDVDEPQRRRVVSQTTAEQINQMLVGVVEGEQGTGRLAAVPGYHVGGKTGTARKPSKTARGYEEGAYIASFAGFGPVEDPALVTAVMLDEPTPIYGGTTAAPVFSEIMSFALRHRRVPPSDGLVVSPAPAP
jgi:cell division protein FtsI (penicillin-binding protein 3)